MLNKIFKMVTSILISGTIICFLSGASRQPEKYVLDGDQYLAQKEYDKAIESYKKALADRSGAIGVYNNLGYIHHYIKQDYEKAKQIYEKGLLIYPENEHLTIGLMNANLYLGNLNIALSQYEILAKGENQSSLGIDVGKIEELILKKGSTEQEIIVVLEKILEINPNDLMVNYHLGMYHLEYKQYKKAIKNYRKVIELDPDKLPSAYSQLASAYSGIKDYVNAKVYFEKAKELGVDVPDEFFSELDRKISNEKNGL